MKFVLFNIAVIAALFFLFDSDKANLSSLAEKAYAAVGLERTLTKETGEIAPEQAAKPSPAPAPTQETKVTALKSVPKNSTDSELEVKVESVVTEPLEQIVATKPETLDPAVAKRRAEVLGSASATMKSPREALQGEDKLMTSDQRRRELFTLAEEMELFYVRRLSR